MLFAPLVPSNWHVAFAVSAIAGATASKREMKASGNLSILFYEETAARYQSHEIGTILALIRRGFSQVKRYHLAGPASRQNDWLRGGR